MNQAIALIRVSTRGQAGEDRGGVAGQRATIERLATQHGYELVGEVQIQVSGAKVLESPDFLALLDRIQAPEIRAVVCADLDRLMRPEDLGYYGIFSRFRDSGTVLVTSAGVRDFTADRLLSVIETEIAHLERHKIRDRTGRAKEAMRRAGRHVGGAHLLPTGVTYRAETQADGSVRGVWGYDWPAAQRIRAVYQGILAGERNLAALARANGLKRESLHGLLRNPIYMGIRRYTERRRDGKRYRRGDSDVIEVRVIEEPLVAPADWHRVQEILTSRRRAPRSDCPGLYRGLLLCDGCQRSLHGTWHSGDRAWIYRCSNASRTGVGCRTLGHMRMHKLDAVTDEAVREHLCRTEMLEALLDAAGESHEGEGLAQLDAELAAKAIRRLEAERGRVLTSYERGLRTLEDAEARVGSIEQEIDALRAVQPAPGPSRPIAELAAELAAPFAEWDVLPRAAKRPILEAAVEAVHVHRVGRGKAEATAIRLRIPQDAVRSQTMGADRRPAVASGSVLLRIAPCGAEATQ